MRTGARESRDDRRARRAFRFRLSTLMLAVLVAGVVVATLGLPGVAMALGMILALALGATAILGVAMGLGWLGFRLFAAFDRLASWSGGDPEWFHPDPDEGRGKPR